MAHKARIGELFVVVVILLVGITCRHPVETTGTAQLGEGTAIERRPTTVENSDCSAQTGAQDITDLEKWFTSVVREGNCPPALRSDRVSAIRRAQRAGSGLPWESNAESCDPFRPESISYVNSFGTRAVPFLVRQLPDEGLTEWAFCYPLSSYLPWQDGEAWLVGEIAAYYIEVVLRDNLYFTRSGRLRYVSEAEMLTIDGRRESLRSAARSYLDWYSRCFDDVKEMVICEAGDLPVVKWDYDLSAGPSFERVSRRE